MKKIFSKKNLKRALLVLAVAFIVIQFFCPKRNHSKDEANSITKQFPVPDSVHAILKASCYDCHSNNTVYPWYASVQPVAWWLNGHIEGAKQRLNFSEFASYTPRKQYQKFGGIAGDVKKESMPLPTYVIIHRYAILDTLQKEMVIQWAEAMRDTLRNHNPMDSLKSKEKPAEKN